MVKLIYFVITGLLAWFYFAVINIKRHSVYSVYTEHKEPRVLICLPFSFFVNVVLGFKNIYMHICSRMWRLQWARSQRPMLLPFPRPRAYLLWEYILSALLLLTKGNLNYATVHDNMQHLWFKVPVIKPGILYTRKSCELGLVLSL